MEFIRNQYRLDPSKVDEDFYRNLSIKSENEIKSVKELFKKHGGSEKNTHSFDSSSCSCCCHDDT